VTLPASGRTDTSIIEHYAKETKMDKDATSQPGIWHRTGFGCRVLSAEAPYSVISPPSAHRQYRDAFRRQALADLAHLTELLSES
jgi:hypothetical protein